MSLRTQVFRGGVFLGMREGVGLVLRLGGVLALTRLLGPTDYGVYAVALSVALLLGTVAQMSVEVRLLRAEHPPTRADFDAASSFLVLSSAVVLALALAFTWTLGRAVLDEQSLGPLTVMLLLLPLNVLWAPGQAMLERDLRFKALAFLEIGGDVVLYAVALPLAVADLGVWAAVAGFAAWQVYRLIGSLLLARYRPRWNFSRVDAVTQVREGARISAYTWIYRANDSLTLLVVQVVLGAAAAGNVALAARLVETLSVVGRVTYRIAIVALGRIQNDGARLRRAVEEGMSLQVLAAAVTYGGFALVSDRAIELAFGREWTGAAHLYPYLAAAGLLYASSNVVSALLVVRKQEPAVAVAATGTLVLAVSLTAGLSPLLGIDAFGIGRVVGIAVSAVLLDRALRRELSFSYRRSVPWLVTGLALVACSGLPPEWRLAAAVLAPGVLLLPGPRAEAVSLVRAVLPGRGATTSSA